MSALASRARFSARPAVVALVLLAAVVRGWDLDAMSLWQDEGLTLYRAAQDWPTILSGGIPLGEVMTRDVQPPLYFLLLAGWFRLVGVGIWAGKWFGLLAGLPTVALLWALGRRLAGRRVGLLAAAFGALSPVYLWYTHELRVYPLLVTLGLLGVYALVRALDEAAGGRARLAWALTSVASGALLVWTHYLGFFLVGFEALVVLAHAARARRGRVAWPLVAVAVLALPLVPFAVERLGIGPERDQHFVPLAVILADVVRGFGLGLTVDHGRMWPLHALGLALAAAGLADLWRRRRAAAALLIGYLGLPILTLYAVTFLKPFYMNVRHILLQSPPYYVLLAAGLSWLARRSVPAALVAGALALGGMAHADRNHYAAPEFAKDDLRGLAAYVDARAVPGDVLVVSHPVLVHAFAPLVERVPVVAVPTIFADWSFDAVPEGQQVAALFETYDRLWFMTPGDEAIAWLEEQAVLVDRQAFHGRTIPVRVDAYEARRGQSAFPPRAPWDGDLGALRLLGWEVAPAELVAGRAARVGLVWQVLADAPPDYKIALRLLDEAGRDYARGDHEPFHGQYPTSDWPVGELTYEPHDLVVSPAAPPGRYVLAATVYDPAGEARFPPDDPFVVGRVTVARPDVPFDPRSVDVGHRLSARGAGLEVIGYDLPAATPSAGDRLPLSVWLRVTGDVVSARSVRAELRDSWGRGIDAAEAPVPGAGAESEGLLPGDLRRVALDLDLPPEAGRYSLRLRLVDSEGRALWLRRGLLPVTGVWLRRVDAVPVERITEAPAVDRAVDVAVGDVGRILGYDGPMSPVMPGAELPVTLYWRAIERTSRSYRVTVQLLPAAGPPPVAQHDGVPGAGARPTTGWTPGEVITDPHAIGLPADLAPGDYALIAALYDPAAPGPRPPVEQDGAVRDYAVLGTVRVAPEVAP